MKKIWVFLLGVLTGIIITCVTLAIIGQKINNGDGPSTRKTSGMTFFEQPGDIIETSNVKVFQALGNGAALAKCRGDGGYIYIGPNVLLYNEEGRPYYDDQVIDAPKGKCFRQVGIYRYSANSGVGKTVPIVMIMDK